MKYFWPGPGADPVLTHRFKVSLVTDEMWLWCEQYDSGLSVDRDFRRWNIEFGQNRGRDHDVIQFEWEQAAIMFALKFETL